MYNCEFAEGESCLLRSIEMSDAAGVQGRLNPALEAVLNFNLQEIRLTFLKGWAAHAIGDICLRIDDAYMDTAELWIKKAIQTHERYRIPWRVASDCVPYADFFKKKGDIEQAREKLNTAIKIFRKCGADGWVKKYEEELARL